MHLQSFFGHCFLSELILFSSTFVLVGPEVARKTPIQNFDKMRWCWQREEVWFVRNAIPVCLICGSEAKKIQNTS